MHLLEGLTGLIDLLIKITLALETEEVCETESEQNYWLKVPPPPPQLWGSVLKGQRCLLHLLG